MANKLKDKTALITGAASGIGAAAAKLLAQEGAQVVIADINDEKGHHFVLIGFIGSSIFCKIEL